MYKEFRPPLMGIEEGYLEPCWKFEDSFNPFEECSCDLSMSATNYKTRTSVVLPGYYCTRPINHPMPHAAHGASDQMICIWDNDRTTDQRKEAKC